MIILHGFGPALGLPDPSPFVVKAEMLLKLAGLPYRMVLGNMRRAPKGKLPLLDDNGAMVADSSFIRIHLEQHHAIDFDAGLTPAQRGTAWAFEKLLEDHLYWAAVHERWLIPENFQAGPAHLFNAVPAPLRPIVLWLVRRKLRANLHAQGMGRHNPAEIGLLAARAVQSLADFMADKPYLMGDRPCGADATVYAFVASGLLPIFNGPVQRAMQSHPNLIAYAQRMTARYYPPPTPSPCPATRTESASF